MRARSIPSLLRQILKSTIVAPAVLGAPACSGRSDPGAPDGAIVGACTPTPDAATLLAGSSDAAPGCYRYELPVAGDAAKCGLYPLSCLGTGPATSADLCAALCHEDGAS